MTRKALCPTPPMGWNSWNTFTENINEEIICSMADAMVETGLLDAGYTYLVIDDCWSQQGRGANGELVADPAKFPHGMKAVADYVHNKGLKFGMYSCCGTKTCAGYPASFGHEFQDASQFASWGVDYLKYDNCFKPKSLSSSLLYRRMGIALANCGRDIVFSACQWGTEDVHTWIRSTGAHLFRSSEDIRNCWQSVKDIALSQMDKQAYSGNYCHNDMDMLVVGMRDGGGTPYIAAGGCTDTEYQTHFALWAMMNSPLMIGCDIRNMSDETKEILMNRDLIALNQDIECRAPYRVGSGFNGAYEDIFVLVKPLSNGEIALGCFNMGETDSTANLEFWDIGLPATGYGLEIYDCLSHTTMGTKWEGFAPMVPAHGCRVFRAKVVSKSGTYHG